MDRADAFKFEVGLVEGRQAPERVRTLICRELELEHHDLIVRYANTNRHSPVGTSQKNDVVLFKEGDGFRAGRVQLHCEVSGYPISLVTIWSLHRNESAAGYAIWACGPEDIVLCIETSDILETVTYKLLPGGFVGTPLLAEFR